MFMLWVWLVRVARSSLPGSPAPWGACHRRPRSSPHRRSSPPDSALMRCSPPAQVIIPPEFMSKDNKRVSRRRHAAAGACGVGLEPGERAQGKGHHGWAWRSSSNSSSRVVWAWQARWRDWREAETAHHGFGDGLWEGASGQPKGLRSGYGGGWQQGRQHRMLGLGAEDGCSLGIGGRWRPGDQNAHGGEVNALVGHGPQRKPVPPWALVHVDSKWQGPLLLRGWTTALPPHAARV